jgi:hypothetical protein
MADSKKVKAARVAGVILIIMVFGVAIGVALLLVLTTMPPD